MPAATLLDRTDPLRDLAPDHVVDRWAERGLDELSDARLVEVAARHLAIPRRDPADSFVLHAPLELMARSALLRLVDPRARVAARQRIAWVVATYDEAAPASDRIAVVPAPDDGPVHPSLIDLGAVVDTGDLDAIDQAAIAVGAATSADELVDRLADVVVPRLAAAGHGSIYLYHLRRLLAASPAAATMARGLLREIGRQPTWALTWMDHRAPGVVPTRDLGQRLLGPPSPGDPGSHFIYPTMSLVERSGLAAELLDEPTRGLALSEARRELLRVAAWSMLQDDPAHAPYGWSHALTMPQATLGVAPWCAEPERAVAVAATYVLGFRSTLGSVTLDPSWRPEARHDLDLGSFLDTGPSAAAAAVWHAPAAELDDLVQRLATFAALHRDAHLAKYTLACLDATRDDPAAGRLYLSAAAFLAGWWAERDGD
ncbi:MAG: hypothetical protein ABW219_09215 [Ilumatobacteraceae bacterium]